MQKHSAAYTVTSNSYLGDWRKNKRNMLVKENSVAHTVTRNLQLLQKSKSLASTVARHSSKIVTFDAVNNGLSLFG